MKKRNKKMLKESEEEVLCSLLNEATTGNVTAQKFIIENQLLPRIKIKGRTPSEMVQSLIKESNKKRSINAREVKEKIELIKLFTETYELYEIEKRLRKLEKKTK